MSSRPNPAPSPARPPTLPPLADGSHIQWRRYGSAAPALVLHFHGGAFTGGSLDSGAVVAQVLADAGAQVFSLDYPLAPGQPFPDAVEAGYTALQWLHRQRKALTGTDAALFLAGEEAGGNIAAAVALIARDRDGPPLAGQVLLSPMLDVCVATASQRDARNGPVGCAWADGWRAYLSKDTDAVHPYAVPGSSMRLSGLPPTLLVTSQDDPLRDETQAYAQRLRAAGVAACSSVLTEHTGWPRSYALGGPWTAALRDLIEPLFRNPFQEPTTTATESHR